MTTFMVKFTRTATTTYVLEVEAPTGEAARDAVERQVDARTLTPPGAMQLETEHDVAVISADPIVEFDPDTDPRNLWLDEPGDPFTPADLGQIDDGERTSDLGFVRWGEIAPDGATAEDFELWQDGRVVGTTRG